MNSVDTLAPAKAALRQQVSQDIFDKLSELQKKRPGVPFETVFAELKSREVDLFAFAERIERNQWDPPKQPIFRYVPGAAAKPAGDLHDILSLPLKVQAKKPVISRDAGVVLVEAGDQQDKINALVQKTMDLNPGLARDSASALVRQTHGDLFAEQDERDAIADKQQTIRNEIKKMQIDDPTLTFSQAWDRLTREQPALFEGFESA